ncbi:hypothetical protein [Fusobacterium nucleatum]|uniref:hypothetical protein n=1 Tax=Fusobacterium nucleatum TaxID=851 RepID=UPI000418B357|nr:hypothetical protein [Fusobacterium nucleatum]ALF24355.1 hypothetical protein RO05_08225 [Fusobacterium nucleatum subsp. nucleatum ChDC F316]ASG26373.1 hypothetical protein RN84_05640 [Fusobacterium nucleatum subsp. nucleatum]
MKILNEKIWQYEKHGIDGEVELFRVNIFDYKWENTDTVAILDPKYNNEYYLNVYKVIIDGKEYEFAAGEVSNCIWIFYLPKERL